MGAHGSRRAVEIDGYPIRITSTQSIELLGILKAKTTLTWNDIASDPKLTYARCRECGLSSQQLHTVQPDIEMWVNTRKVRISDCPDMSLWAPNPFIHFNCNIGELVLHRRYITPAVLVRSGVTFHILWERYGLNGDLMAMLAYAPEDWIALGINEEYIGKITDAQWASIFVTISRTDMLRSVATEKCRVEPP